MDKRLIAGRFARARDTYNREAHIQQQIARKMICLLRHTLPDASFDHIAEFGCGTGLYSQLLFDTWHPSLLHLNDLCPEMHSCLTELTANSGVSFEAGDAETCPLPGYLDLLTSCSALQWFTSPAAFFNRSTTLLRPGGVLAFSTFGRRNLHEIRTQTGNGLEYTPPGQLKKELEAAGYRVLHLEEEETVLHFPTPIDVLYHLRMTGVTGIGKHTWSREHLQAFCNEYIRRFGSTEGVSLTYQPIHVICIAGKQRMCPPSYFPAQPASEKKADSRFPTHDRTINLIPENIRT